MYQPADNLCSCGHTLHFGKCKSNGCDCETIYYGVTP
jgi:hypothetical protein